MDHGGLFDWWDIVYIVYLLLMACLFSNGVHVFFQIEAESITFEKWNWLKRRKYMIFELQILLMLFSLNFRLMIRMLRRTRSVYDSFSCFHSGSILPLVPEKINLIRKRRNILISGLVMSTGDAISQKFVEKKERIDRKRYLRYWAFGVIIAVSQYW